MKQGRVAIGLALSGLIHVGVAVWLLQGETSTQFGTGAYASGSGTPLGGENDRGAVFLLLRSPSASRADSLDAASQPARDPITSALAASPTSAASSSSQANLQQLASLKHEAASFTATGETMAHGAGEHPSPSPGATEDASAGASVLEQIRRCLPPGVDTRMKAATLELEVDASGRLVSPPRVGFDQAAVGADEALGADEMVQATMQCAPYQVSSDHAVEMRIALDDQ